MRPSLNDLAVKHATDKGRQDLDAGADFAGQHYVDMYERWAAPNRDKPISILEIGVHTGNSLRMWAEYFPQARIAGVDNQPSLTACDNTYGGRILLVLADQRNVTAMTAMARDLGPFDLIVDDGCHVSSAQLTTAATLLPFLQPDGWYVIEDVQDVATVTDGLRNAVRSDYDMRLYPSAHPTQPWWMVILEHKRAIR